MLKCSSSEVNLFHGWDIGWATTIRRTLRSAIKLPERYEQEHQLKLGGRPQEEESKVGEKEDISLQGQQACWTAAMLDSFN